MSITKKILAVTLPLLLIFGLVTMVLSIRALNHQSENSLLIMWFWVGKVSTVLICVLEWVIAFWVKAYWRLKDWPLMDIQWLYSSKPSPTGATGGPQWVTSANQVVIWTRVIHIQISSKLLIQIISNFHRCSLVDLLTRAYVVCLWRTSFKIPLTLSRPEFPNRKKSYCITNILDILTKPIKMTSHILTKQKKWHIIPTIWAKVERCNEN